LSYQLIADLRRLVLPDGMSSALGSLFVFCCDDEVVSLFDDEDEFVALGALSAVFLTTCRESGC
tara:strand:+ start:310 stop:501 length:192 start_codon:yes stop_codon:yes gene_type:complete